MNNERLIARGRLVELEQKRFALLTEIRTLTDDIRRKVPTPEPGSTDITGIKSQEAIVLINRLAELQSDFTKTQCRIVAVVKEFGFVDPKLVRCIVLKGCAQIIQHGGSS